MGIDEIDLTIYPFTVGREDCRVLPRSFKTLPEAEAYLAEQDKGALQHGQFYLDGPEQDSAPSNSHTASIAKTQTVVAPPATAEPVVAAPAAAEPGQVDSERTRVHVRSKRTLGTWTRDVEELCRALEED
jgi:hypothetical protein